MQVSLPEVHPTVDQECDVGVVLFTAVCLIAKFGAPDSGEGLARRPAYQHIHLLVYSSAYAEVAKDVTRIFLCDVAGLEVALPILAMTDRGKVRTVGLGGPRITFDRGDDFKSG